MKVDKRLVKVRVILGFDSESNNIIIESVINMSERLKQTWNEMTIDYSVILTASTSKMSRSSSRLSWRK